MKKHMKTLLLYLVVIALIIAAVSLIFNNTSKEKAKLSEIVDYFEKDLVASFVIDKSYNLTLNVWSCNPSAMRFYESQGLIPQKICMEKIL
jgi:hypothetical protein